MYIASFRPVRATLVRLCYKKKKKTKTKWGRERIESRKRTEGSESMRMYKYSFAP